MAVLSPAHHRRQPLPAGAVCRLREEGGGLRLAVAVASMHVRVFFLREGGAFGGEVRGALGARRAAAMRPSSAQIALAGATHRPGRAAGHTQWRYCGSALRRPPGRGGRVSAGRASAAQPGESCTRALARTHHRAAPSDLNQTSARPPIMNWIMLLPVERFIRPPLPTLPLPAPLPLPVHYATTLQDQPFPSSGPPATPPLTSGLHPHGYAA